MTFLKILKTQKLPKNTQKPKLKKLKSHVSRTQMEQSENKPQLKLKTKYLENYFKKIQKLKNYPKTPKNQTLKIKKYLNRFQTE